MKLDPETNYKINMAISRITLIFTLLNFVGACLTENEHAIYGWAIATIILANQMLKGEKIDRN